MIEEKMHQTRVVGGGNTVLYMATEGDIAFLTQVSDTPPKVLGTTAVIQPLNSKYPVDIVTGNAVSEGSMTLTLVEVWNEEAWNRLVGYENAKDISAVYDANRAIANGFSLTKMIKTPSGKTRGWVYTGCIITDIADDESVKIDDMTKEVLITVTYLRRTPVG